MRLGSPSFTNTSGPFRCRVTRTRWNYMPQPGVCTNVRWQGVTPRSPRDRLIAATAVDKRIPLLHDDRDFEQLALVEPKLKLIPRR